MREFTLTITGTAPLLMHNSQLSDPLNKWSKEIKKISSKRSKTDDDLLEMSHLEFMGGLYYDTDLGPVLPAMMIEASIRDGAKRRKLGKDVTRGLRITDQVTPLVYEGPRDAESLWGDGESGFVDRASVKVGMARVMRTRPIFREWVAEVNGMFDETIFNPEVVDDIIGLAGTIIGIGDFRPRFGTFTHKLEVH